MTNEDGTGQQFEIAKAVYETLGYKIKCKTYPYKRAKYYVEIEKADVMVGMLKTDSEKLIFAKFPHDADNIIAIYPKNKNIKWDGISTLKIKINLGKSWGLIICLNLIIRGVRLIQDGRLFRNYSWEEMIL